MAEVVSKERRIMVAVDESEESMYALSWCLENMILQNSKDTLILLYVRPPPVVYTAVDDTGYLFPSNILDTMEEYSQQVAHSVMEKAKQMCKNCSDVKVETRVETGDARDVICKMVDKLHVDILVMGSRGYGVIKRAFLGSVSNYCAHRVKCPVTIVKRPKSSSRRNKSAFTHSMLRYDMK